jgi:hypothetical protein
VLEVDLAGRFDDDHAVAEVNIVLVAIIFADTDALLAKEVWTSSSWTLTHLPGVIEYL